MNIRKTAFAALLLMAIVFQSSLAQQAISPFVVASGGGEQAGEASSLVATVGQPVAGAANRLLAGFWYTFDASTVTSIEEGPEDLSVPSSFVVHQNYPNPFNPSTTIIYELPESSDVSIAIVDALGRLVSRTFYRNKPAGVHTITWDGRDNGGSLMPSGTYWYLVRAGNNSTARMMVLVK